MAAGVDLTSDSKTVILRIKPPWLYLAWKRVPRGNALPSCIRETTRTPISSTETSKMGKSARNSPNVSCLGNY